MHRCLLIHEIAQLVAAHLNDGDDDDELSWAAARNDLAHMALSCRAFYEPAINELWSRLDGLRPLVECLPSDAIDEHAEGSDWDNAITITRVPASHEWVRFQYFARRVKTLCITEYQSPEYAVDYDVFDVLQLHHPGPVLPNLVRLDICEYDKPEIILMFIQPTLRHARINTTCSDTTFALLQLIKTHAPKLEELEIDQLLLTDDVSGPFSDTICALGHLKSLDFACIPLHSDAIVHLSSLPNFHELSLEITQHNANAPSSVAWGNFPTLTSLTILTHLFNTASPAALLRALDGQCLTQLAVTVHSDHVTSLDHLFAAIGNLNHLVSCELYFENINHNTEYVDGVILSPLSRLSFMKTFVLEDLLVEFSPADLLQLAMAWPSIQHLEITDGVYAQLKGSMSLLDLAIFAEHCPLLEHLAVKIRPVADDWSWRPDTEMLEQHPCSQLSSLVVRRYRGMSRSAMQDMLSFLKHTFPVARQCNL